MKKKTCGAVRSIFDMRAMRCGLAAKKRFYFFACTVKAILNFNPSKMKP
jgi:hypothetical protein